MKYREKLGYIALGGVLMLVGMLAAGLFAPLRAQHASDGKFGKITCTGLEVVRPDGQRVASISFGHYDNGRITGDAGSMYAGEYGGEIFVYDRYGEVVAGVGFDDDGGRVDVVGKDENSAATMGVHEGGGLVSVLGNNESQATVGITEHGGRVEVRGKDGFSGVDMRVNEYDSGIVEVESKGGKTASVAGGHVGVAAKGGGGGVLLNALDDGGHVYIIGLQPNKMGGYPIQASMGVEDHGGYVSAFRTDGKSAASMGASVHGGQIAVFDENEKSWASMRIDEYGGYVDAFGKDGASSASMRIDGHGGRVYVSGKGDNNPRAVMDVNEDGGTVSVYGKAGGSAHMILDEFGGRVEARGKDKMDSSQLLINKYGGMVRVFGRENKEGRESANMGIDEYGGTVSVFGWGNKYSTARMGVGNSGDGVVSTWDKNGYRLATLK